MVYTLFMKMAASVVHSDSLSLNCSENNSNINEFSCKKCTEYELQLREALDELGLARKIIKILQKELSTRLIQKVSTVSL